MVGVVALQGAEGGATEAALIEAGRAGDEAALERLLALHKEALYGLCYGILGHVDDVEDAVQETLLRALRSLPGFRGDAAFRTWLFRIGVNVCLRWKITHPPTEPWDEETAPRSRPPASAETLALRRLRMREALNSLRPRHRAILLLKEREGWSIGEIASALRCSKKRIENDLYQARCALADWRQREGAEGDPR